MASHDCLPLANIVQIEPYDPPRRLWHMPNTPPGICPGCETRIERAKLTSAGHDWHPDCFRCSLCRQPFSNAQCVTKDDLVLHEECYKICFCERCATCCQLIDPQKNVQAIGRSFHQKCFVCVKCGEHGESVQRGVTLYGFPYCRSCFEDLQENLPKCLTCKKVILPSSEHREFFFKGKKHFVHFPDCFKCSYCTNPPHTKSCGVFKDKLACKSCYDDATKRICAECNEPIFGQPAKMENIYWHQEHFKCSSCQQPLKSNTAVFNTGILKCRACSAEDKAKCGGCGDVVSDKGVHACGSIWHNDCLKCKFCNQSVLTKKFANIKNKPCCVDCYQKLKSEQKIDKRGQLIDQTDE